MHIQRMYLKRYHCIHKVNQLERTVHDQETIGERNDANCLVSLPPTPSLLSLSLFPPLSLSPSPSLSLSLSPPLSPSPLPTSVSLDIIHPLANM